MACTRRWCLKRPVDERLVSSCTEKPLLMKRHGMAAEAAYCLCSVAVNLRLSEIVNAPNWVVSASLRNDLFN